MSQWLMLDFECPAHGKHEVMCDKREGIPDRVVCPYRYNYAVEPPDTNQCALMAQRVTSYAVTGRMKLGEVTQEGQVSPSADPEIYS